MSGALLRLGEHAAELARDAVRRVTEMRREADAAIG
jgi:hypothetical protein